MRKLHLELPHLERCSFVGLLHLLDLSFLFRLLDLDVDVLVVDVVGLQLDAWPFGNQLGIENVLPADLGPFLR